MLKEKDCLGEMEIPEDVYYGIQTERARNNFGISGTTIDDLPDFLCAIAEIKKAAARANARIGALDERIADAICKAADEVIAGKHAGMFPIDVLSALLGYPKGTEIAQRAVAEGKTVKEIVRTMRAFPDEEIDELFAPLMMTDWTQSSKLLSGEKIKEM